MKRLPRRTLTAALLVLTFAAALILGSDAWVRRTGGSHCHTQTSSVPQAAVALVLGCSPRLADGRHNLFFGRRIQAAAELYHAGKARALIVSGDNSTKHYDEPTAMKEALIHAGVPAAAIYCDYAGFRTLDSVVRAHAIFGQRQFIIVSQRFHNERAVFLARQHGLVAHGFDAPAVSRRTAPTTHLREYLARVKAVLDVTLLRTRPKYLGPPIQIVLE